MVQRKPIRKTPKKAAKKATSRPRRVAKGGKAVSGRTDRSVRERGDWRGRALARIRRLIQAAAPEAIEEVKWRKPTNPAGVPVWSHEGIICTGETYKSHVRLTFPRGSELKDPARLFNANLEGVRRAIQISEGDAIHEAAFQALIREAVVLNLERNTRG